MSKKKSTVILIALFVLGVVALAVGGGSWLWHMLLRMHGIH